MADRVVAPGHKPLIVTLCGLWVILACFYLPPGSAYARVHDYLEGLFANYLVYKQLGEFFFDYDVIAYQVLNGTPINYIGLSEFSLGQLLFRIFQPFDAYVIQQFIFRSIAVIGFYFLLTDHFFPASKRYLWYAALIGFSFAIIQHLPSRFGTILLQPILLWALLNISRCDYRIRNFAIVCVFPLTSMFTHGGFIICFFSFGLALVAFVSRLSARRMLFLAALLLTGVSIFVEHRLFYQTFFSELATHRKHWDYGPWGAEAITATFLEHFTQGHEHHVSEHSPFILFVAVITVVLIFYRWKRPRKYENLTLGQASNLGYIFFTILGALVLFSLIYSIDHVVLPLGRYLQFPFKLHRIDVLSPLGWRLLFAVSIVIISESLNSRAEKGILTAAIILISLHATLQLPGVKQKLLTAGGFPAGIGFRDAVLGKYVETERTSRQRSFDNRYHGYASLDDYFKTNSFKRIGKDIDAVTEIGRSQYRVLNIGLSFSVPLYHGFYPLDGYYFNFLSSYPEEFYKIFEKEARKDFRDPAKDLRGRFYGNRVYPYISAQSWKGSNIIEPDIDICHFSEMGGKFIFSRFEIGNFSKLSLNEFGVYGDLFVYVVEPELYCG